MRWNHLLWMTWKLLQKVSFMLFLLLYSEWALWNFNPHRTSSLFAHALWISDNHDRHCSCSPLVLQEAFCRSDFVVVGRYQQDTFTNITKDNDDGRKKRMYRVKIRASLKGEMRLGGKYDIHVIVDDNTCGWTEDYLRPKVNYLIAGRRVGDQWLVSRCFWLQPYKQLSVLQKFSLFNNVYRSICTPDLYDSCDMGPVVLMDGEAPSKCQYDHRLGGCYSKFAVCIPSSCNFVHQPPPELQTPVSPHRAIKRFLGLSKKRNNDMHSLYNLNSTEDMFQICTRDSLLNSIGRS